MQNICIFLQDGFPNYSRFMLEQVRPTAIDPLSRMVTRKCWVCSSIVDTFTLGQAANSTELAGVPQQTFRGLKIYTDLRVDDCGGGFCQD